MFHYADMIATQMNDEQIEIMREESRRASVQERGVVKHEVLECPVDSGLIIDLF